MLRFVLPLALFCVFSCSKEQPPTAPAGKAVDFGSMFDSFNDQQKEEGTRRRKKRRKRIVRPARGDRI